MKIALSVLVLLLVSSISGCASDVRPQIKSALDIAAEQQKLFCKAELSVEAPAWAQCKSLDVAMRGAELAVDIGNEDTVLGSAAEVLEGLKAVWHVKCDETPASAFCSGSKSVVNALIGFYSAVNEGSQ